MVYLVSTKVASVCTSTSVSPASAFEVNPRAQNISCGTGSRHRPLNSSLAAWCQPSAANTFKMSARAPLVGDGGSIATGTEEQDSQLQTQNPHGAAAVDSDEDVELRGAEAAEADQAGIKDNDCDTALPATAAAGSPPGRWSALWWKATLLKWHLPLLIVLAVILGASWPAPASAANDTPLGIICIVVIFFISGLKLKTEALFEALSNYRAWLFGIFSIMGLTSCVSLALVHIPLPQKEFPLGLAIFFVMPTTISSCIVLTGQAKGNVALALFLSVATNLLSIVLVPLWLTAVLASASDVTLDVVSLLVRLVLTVLLPLVAGKLAQLIPGVNTAASKHKNTLKVLSSLFLCLIPWTKVSTAAEPLRNTPAEEIIAVLAIGMAVHVVFLIVNTLAARALALKWPEQAAVVLAGSQKTLSVAVAVVDAAPAELGNSGLLLLPCLLSHFAQIVMDALLFSVLRNRMQRIAQQQLDESLPAGGDGADNAACSAASDDEGGVALVHVHAGGEGTSISPLPLEADGEGGLREEEGGGTAEVDGGEGGLLEEEGKNDENTVQSENVDDSTLLKATASQSAECRAVLRSVPQSDTSASGPAGAVPLSQQLRAAATAAGHASLGEALEADILEDGPLHEEPRRTVPPRVGSQYQVADLPVPKGAT